MIAFLKKIISIFKVKANDAVGAVAGADTLERATLSQIKEKLDRARSQCTTLEARLVVMRNKAVAIDDDIKVLDETIDFNVAQYKQTNDDVYKTRSIASINAKKDLIAAKAQMVSDSDDLDSAVANIKEMIGRLETVYRERDKTRKNASTRNKIAENTAAAADLINELQGFGIGDGEGVMEKANEREAEAKIKMQQAMDGIDATPDFIKESKKDMRAAEAEQEFADLLK